MEDNIIKWIREAKRSKSEDAPFYKNLYVLVGPPAVGKTSWIEDNIINQGVEFVVISRDQIIEDQIFPKYKLTNNELYAMNPPEDAEVGKIIPGMEKFGIVITRSNGKKMFSNVAAANAEVENLIKKEYDSVISIINQLPKEEKYNVVIDAINATPVERQKVLTKFQNIKNMKKIAVYFNFKEYKEEISARADKRAEKMKKEFGFQFDRAVPSKTYDAIFKRIEKPTETEGFDDVTSYDSFKGVNLEPFQELTAESATLKFRNFLNSASKVESNILEEAKLSKIWRRRAKERARRHERAYPNKIDRSWALKQQAKWNKEHPELEEEYLKEIDAANSLVKHTKEYLNKIKTLRKQKLEAKKNSLGIVKFGKTNKPKKTLKPITNKGIGPNRLPKTKMPKVGPAGQFGPLEEEIRSLEQIQQIVKKVGLPIDIIQKSISFSRDPKNKELLSSLKKIADNINEEKEETILELLKKHSGKTIALVIAGILFQTVYNAAAGDTTAIGVLANMDVSETLQAISNFYRTQDVKKIASKEGALEAALAIFNVSS